MKFGIEMELQSPVEQVWNALKESSTVFPDAIPHIYHDIQILKGDGISAGSVRLINYMEGKIMSCATEKILSVDEKSKRISYSMIDGDVLKFYKYFNNSIAVVPKGDGSQVTWHVEYENKSEAAPSEIILRDFAIINLKSLDEYLIRELELESE